MSRVKHEHYDPCGDPNSRRPGCERPMLERLRFWNGRFLVARDLRDQQEDLIRRLEYHQSFAHGEGVLCGFEVRQHPRETCRDRYLVVESGMAYDCCGHTLWMPDCRVVEIPELERTDKDPAQDERDQKVLDQNELEKVHELERQKRAQMEAERREREAYMMSHAGPQARPGFERPRPEPRPDPPPDVPERRPDPEWFLVACHVECPTDPTPALYADDLCEPMREEHGRMREDVAIRVVPASEISDVCWPRYRAVRQVDCTEVTDDDCHHPLGETPPCHRACACGDCVVLAGVWRDRRTGQLHWSTTHRKVLAPPTNLTKITGMSWPHGGEMTTEQLLDDYKGQLVVRFSRPLQPADGLRNGINPMTFTVSFLGSARHYEQIVPPEPEELQGRPVTPRLSQNGRCAIFDLEHDMLRGRFGYSGSYIHVRVLCDFLVDCHGRAPSGAHIAGDAMGRGTGNGVPGGVFESWFYLRNAGRGDKA